MSTLSELLPAGSGGKNVDFTANGTISQGDAVAIESSGQVAAITQSTQTQGGNSGQVGETQSVEMSASVFDPTRQCLVVAYRNNNNNNYGQGKGFVPNGSTGSSASFTVGNTYLLAGSSATTQEKTSNYLSGTFDSTNNYVVFVWRDGNNHATAVTGVAGANPTFNTISTAISSGTNFTPEICYDSTNQKIVVVSSDFNSNCLNYNVGTVNSNGTITFGTQVTGFQPSGALTYFQNKMAFDSTNNKVCLTYMNSSGVLYSLAGTVSGNSISWGSPYSYAPSYQGAGTSNPDFAIAYDPIGNSITGVFRILNSSNYPGLLNLRYSTANSRFETIATPKLLAAVSMGNGSCGAGYSALAKKVIITYWLGSGQAIYAQTVDVSGNTITESSPAFGVTTPSGGIEYVSLGAMDVTGTLGQASIFFKNNNASNRGDIFIYTAGVAQTNVSGFIGVADENIANAATGSVTVKGGIATNGLSGLTPNQNYYVADDGTISTTSTGLKIGKALSSTSINLEFNS